MRLLIIWVKTQILYFHTSLHVACFDQKATHQKHFLGFFWEFLNPAIQIGIYYIVFGIRLEGHAAIDSDIPYLYWMMSGVIPWFYISSSIISGTSSIYSNLNLIEKTHFSIAILPTISLLKGLTSFFTMISIFMVIYIGTGHLPTLSWLQLLYYFFAMEVLLLAITTLTSVVVVLFRDFQLIINAMMRLLFFASGAIVNVTSSKESLLGKLFQLNPFVYIIEGFRDAFFARRDLFNEPSWDIYFWMLVLCVLTIGIYLLNRYQSKFVEYL